MTVRPSKAQYASLLAMLGLALLGAMPSAVQAATYTVDRTDDNAGAAACTGAGNDCSLRGAITAANSNVGADTINIPAGTYTLSIAGRSNDTNTTGDLDIRESVTITGAGAASTIIDGGDIDRVIDINPALNVIPNVIISGVTVQNGSASDGLGGGIGYYGADGTPATRTGFGTLTLTDCIITSNIITASGGNEGGGGLLVEQGNAVITNCIFSNNQSQQDNGGGICNIGINENFTMTNSTVTGNSTNGIFEGAGMFIRRTTSGAPAAGSIQISNCLISNNTASSRGGAISTALDGTAALTLNLGTILSSNTSQGTSPGVAEAGGLYNSNTGTGTTTLNAVLINSNTANSSTEGNEIGGGGISNNAGAMNLVNTTLSGNLAGLDGGGFLNRNASSCTMTNVTIANNQADSDGNASGAGGGINRLNGTVVVRNTVVSGNTATDVAGTVNTTQNNVIGAGGGLDVLANNGGTTAGAVIGPFNFTAPMLTHALLSTSLALDAGDSALISGTDQRGAGYFRILDGPDGDAVDEVDVGAFEAHPSVQNVTDQSINEDTTLSTSFNVGDSNLTSGLNTITVTSSNTTLVPNANINLGGSGTNSLSNSTNTSHTLVITPVSNLFGQTTITISISDLYNGSNRSMTDTFVLTVVPIADPPTITTATTNEDVQTSSGLVISRNAVDGAEVTHFRITSITNGTVFKNNGTTQINSGDYITFAEGNAGLKFTPAPNQFSPTTAFGFTAAGATSAGGAGLGTGTPVTITVNPVADPPVITPATTNEDVQTTSGLVISRNAVDSTEVTHFQITNITNGTLFKNNGTTQINNNDFITFAEGNAGLKFTPSANFFGIGTFTAAGAVDNTGTGLGTGTPVNITVNPVADPPSITTATTNEDVQTSSGLVISRNAVDGGEVTHFQITGITGGTLFKNNGTTQINNNDFITFAEGNAGLKFTPAPNQFSPTTAFGFTAAGATSAGGAGLGTGTAVSITVNPIADAPSITTTTTAEDTQSTTGLVISRNAVDSTEVSHFRITSITNGTLFKNNGTTQINNGDYITFAEGNAGLKFTPSPDLNSQATTFGFIAAGATNGAGTGLGVGTAVSITVTEVNDAPTAFDDSPSNVAEDSAQRTISFASLLANDTKGPANESGQTLTITGVSNVVGGTAIIQGTDVLFTPTANYNGPAGFDYTLSDNGTTNGANDFKTDTGLVSFTITEVNDAPVAGDDALSNVAEDSAQRTISFASLLANDTKGPANESGQTLTITGVSNVVGGAAIIQGTDVLFTPTANFNGPAGFDYTLSDNGTTNGAAAPLTDTGAVSFTITEVNDAPVAGDDTLSDIAEGSGARTISFASLLANDTKGAANESGQTLTITAVNNAVGGTATIQGTDVIFTPTASYNGPASFDYTLSDNGTTNGVAAPLTDTGAVSFNITGTNDPPVAGDDLLSNVAEDSGARTISFASLLANDTKGVNENGQTLNIIAVNNAVGGTATIQGTDVIFTPTANYNGPAGFEYTVQDNGTTNGANDFKTDIGAVSFTITEVNDAPVALDDSPANVTEDSGQRTISFASLLANDTRGAANESGQTLTITAVNNAVGGTATIQGTDVLFTPTSNYNGPAGFDYTVQDNGTTNGVAAPLTDTGLVSFTITEVNDAPVAGDDTLSNVAEDSAQRTISFASLLANDTKGAANESGQTLTITAVNNVVGGAAIIQGTDVLFTPTANFNGPAGFDYTLSDNGTTNGAAAPLTDTGAVSFTITEINDAPVAGDDSPANVTEDSGQRTFTFASLLGNDSKGAANESGQTLTITAVNNAVGGTAVIQGTDVLFTPPADYNGPASFEYTVQDNGTTNGAAAPLTDTGLVSFTITEVNDAPVAGDDTLSNVAEDSAQRTISFASLLGNDTKGAANESGQTLTITAVNNAVGGTATIQGTDVLFTPTADFNGPAGFDYTLSDNGTTNGAAAPLTDTGAVSFTITEVNDAPVAFDDFPTDVAEDSGQRTLSFASLLGNDNKGAANESGQTLTITAVSTPIGGTAVIQGTNVLFTPTADYNGSAGFTYTVEDNGTTNGVADPLTDTGLVSFTITEVNDAPTAGDDSLSAVDEDSAQRTISFASLLANDTKGDANESGQTLTITAVSNVVGGTAIIQGTDVLFTPAANFHGTASFDYTVQDDGTTNGANDFKTDTGTVTFTVNPIADTPSVTNATTTVNDQTTSGLVISASAADGAEVTHFKITAITNGTLYKNDGTTQINNGNFITVAEGNDGLKFTPANNLFSPTTSFSFGVQASLSNSDAGLGGGVATATITVIDPGQGGASLTVNTTDDHNDGTCGATDCSLREAINAANNIGGANTITFSSTVFASAQTITLNGTQLPAVTTDITITGTSAGVTVSGNQASRVMLVSGGTLHLNLLSLIDGAVTGDQGGGLRNDGGSVTIDRSTLSGHSATNGDGGAIYNNATGGTASLTINNSTISDNQTTQSGGAISNFSDTGGTATATINNSTLSGNTATVSGGGIYNQQTGGTATTTLANTILNNSNGNLANSGGTITSQGYNLSSDAGGGFLNQTGDQTSTDPKLDPAGLQPNGGPTKTIKLLAGSPAIEGGNPAFNGQGKNDQRGPGFQRVRGMRVDIGAYELQDPTQTGTSLLVNTTDDHDDGYCGVLDCSLREAIVAANADPANSVITFDRKVFVTPGTYVFNLNNALPNLGGTVTIHGFGANVLTVRRNSVDVYRIFTIPAGVTATINGLTISNGNGVGESGGGISNAGTLILNNVALQNNASDVNGGGLYNDAGATLTVNKSTISGNTGGQGGGIHNAGSLTVNDSTIADNSGNTAGIYNNGTLNLSRSTVASNTSNKGGAGGVTNNATANVNSSLIALNTGGPGTDVAGTFASQGYNVVGKADTVNGNGFAATDDKTGTVAVPLNVRLDPAGLKDNGGPTKTIALLELSPAINNGDPAFVGTGLTDQRGAGFPRVVARLDSGAVERNTAPVNVELSPTNATGEVDVARTFVARYADTEGIIDMAAVELQINTNDSGVNALRCYYDPNSNKLYLRNDANTAWLGAVAPGSDVVISNSQGSLNAKNTAISMAGNTLTVRWNVTPKAVWAGTTQNMYLFIKDKENHTDGWDNFGTFTITASTAPTNDSVTPNSGSSSVGAPRLFTTKYSDPDGVSNLAFVEFQINTSSNGVNALRCYYDPNSNKVYLRNDANTAWLGAVAPGTNVVLSNSQGSLNVKDTSFSTAGNTLTVHWSVTPKAKWANTTQRLYLFVKDKTNKIDDWENFGTWSITAATISTPDNGPAVLLDGTASSSSSTIKLAFDGSLPAGDFTVTVNGQPVKVQRVERNGLIVTLFLPTGSLRPGYTATITWDGGTTEGIVE